MKTKHMFYGLLFTIVLIQFFPIDTTPLPVAEGQELHEVFQVPSEVSIMLKNACYDCHSHITRYPWYAFVQPVGWWIHSHVEDGRNELNFSGFARWNAAERLELLDHCARMIEKGAMPTADYLRMHPRARLDARQKNALIGWLRNPQSMPAQRINWAKDSCDDNDAHPRCCFIGMPDSLTSVMNIAGDDEPGERLFVGGQVFRADGKTPYANVLLYAYHTNLNGIYAAKGGETGIHRLHGRFHGWCRTDAQGRYSIRTIRPAPYPGGRSVAHIHVVVQEPGGNEPYYINDTVFSDDELVDDRYRAQEKRRGGSSGITDVSKNKKGDWEGVRNIVLQTVGGK
jgi:protocatechuate 3,4-dioxygenase beta subunit